MTQWKRRRKKRSPFSDSRTGGFTLVEVMFASTIALFLFLTLLETMSMCMRMAANVKWRLAADVIAYDEAWDKFNQSTAWFDLEFSTAKANWEVVSTNQAPVWYGGGTAFKFWSVTPVGVPVSNWIIRTNVQWPIPGGQVAQLPNDYVIERYRVDRKLFKSTH